MRPALVIIGSTFGDYKTETVIPLATSIEIMHMATLIHDDIVDDAETRRGIKTMQSALGKNTAVYCGDFLFTRAFMLVADMAEVDMLKDLSKAIAYICDSEIDQNEQKFDQTVDVRKYLKRIGGKTAALFALSLAMGAHKAGCDKKLTSKLTNIGKNIGMAFQIVDDILDFTGNEKTVGKPLLSDAKQGIYTLPVIYSLQGSYKEETMKAIEMIDEDSGESLLECVIKSGGLERTKGLARKFIKKALKIKDSLPDGYGKDAITSIIEKQLERKF
ncbi:MAG TPA: polyprenyl synthetase family protein [Thermoclostridium caenicola]|uniref:polyprenyl synthetase family protein n=1 Tax=Thermoclostridium caenicola TaxID=659425 RepID=UPI002CD4D356|nr:polyprenyl synthetase family protein [Thermoclostridium caenicola]HPO76125.1 polyprenyl synthetase family protein [Thermoclostridium caenicola]